jgi:hypothetical protein
LEKKNVLYQKGDEITRFDGTVEGVRGQTAEAGDEDGKGRQCCRCKSVITEAVGGLECARVRKYLYSTQTIL